MNNTGKKVGYLKGLLEGLSAEDNSPSAKLLRGVVDLLGDLSDRLDGVDELLDDLNDYVESIDDDLSALEDEADGDGLNFLAGTDMDFIRDRAMEGTLLAHTEGGVPNIIVEADGKTAEGLGQLIYFFEYACGLSGYLLDVNPFDQPGVEAYKKNMFALLGKPGYEELKAELEARL